MEEWEALKKRFEQIVIPRARKLRVLPEHWIHGWDEGFSFCEECGLKKIEELKKEDPDGEYVLDGGWHIEGDGDAFCDTCHVQLDNIYTNYAVESTLDHFEEMGFNPKSERDCYSMDNVLGAALFEGGEHSSRIQAIARKTVDEFDSGKKGKSRRRL